MKPRQSVKGRLQKIDLGIICDYALPMINGNAQVFEKVFVGINQGKIIEFSHSGSIDIKKQRARCRNWIDGNNFALLPGLVNGHTHLAMTLFRGLEDDAPLQTWLFERIFPMESLFVSKIS